MTRCCTVIAFCMLLAACDSAATSITGPSLPGPDTATGFTVSGRVQAVDGAPISGAVVLLQGAAASRTALSDERGEYRITDVRGFFVLKISKEDLAYSTNLFVANDLTIDVTLNKPSIPLTLTAGVTLLGTIQSPPCDPAWDAEAPCAKVHFTPPATGVYELLLTWKGPSAVDLLIDGNLALYWESYTGEIRVTVPGQAGVQQELQIHAYHRPYQPEPFALTASLKAGS
jgi:carboxypeptidase family protein